MLGPQEDGRRRRGNLAEPGGLAAALEAPPLLARPGDFEAVRPAPALDAGGNRESRVVARHVGQRRAAKRALPAHERRSLEKVGLALRVLPRDESHTPAKRDGVRGEVAEALVGDLGKQQAVLSHLEGQSRIGMTT